MPLGASSTGWTFIPYRCSSVTPPFSTTQHYLHLSANHLVNAVSSFDLLASSIRVRHYGLFAPSNLATKLVAAKEALAPSAGVEEATSEAREPVTKEEEVPPEHLCPKCGHPMERAADVVGQERGPTWAAFYGPFGRKGLSNKPPSRSIGGG